MTEHDIQNKIRIALSEQNIYTMRVNAGSFWSGKILAYTGNKLLLENPTRIQGADAGTSDLVGMRTVTITPEMVGSKIAQFIAIEIKKPGETPRKNQLDYINMVNLRGGVGGWADSVEMANKLLGVK